MRRPKRLYVQEAPPYLSMFFALIFVVIPAAWMAASVAHVSVTMPALPAIHFIGEASAATMDAQLEVREVHMVDGVELVDPMTYDSLCGTGVSLSEVLAQPEAVTPTGWTMPDIFTRPDSCS